MNKYKNQYKIIDKNVNLSEEEKLQAMEDLLEQLSSKLSYVDEQYNYYQETSVVPKIAPIPEIISLTTAITSFIFSYIGMSTGNESLGYGSLITTFASLGIFIPSYMLAGGENHDPLPLPFTKAANFKHELKQLLKVITKLQSEIEARKIALKSRNSSTLM